MGPWVLIRANWYKVSLNRLRHAVLRPHKDGELRIDDLTFDGDGGAFSAYIRSEITEHEAQRMMLRGRVKFVARVPVLTRNVRKGRQISSTDLKWAEVSLRLLGDQSIETFDQIVGQAANRNLRQNQSLKPSDLRNPIMIPKGTMVTVSLKTGGLSLSGTGRALEDGSHGEVIQIMNLQSKRTLEASVVAPSHVRVALRRQVAVAVTANR